MQNIPLYHAIATLNKQEKEQFGYFVSCPLYNTNKRLPKLLDYLADTIQKNNADSVGTNLDIELDAKKIYSVIYPNESFDNQRLKDARSLLFRLLKRFWALQEVEKQEETINLAVLNQLRTRQLPNLYSSHLKAFQKQKKQSKQLNSIERFGQNHLLAEEQNNFIDTNELRQTEDCLQEMMDYFDLHYISKKLKWSCAMLNRSRIVNTEYHLNLLNEIIEIIESQPQHLNTPLIELYYLTYLTITEAEQENHFFKLKKLLEKYTNQIDKEEAIDLYRYAQNYCIGRINKGESQYMQELFGIYKELLKEELLYEKGHLPHPHYKNIVTLGLRLNEHEWTKSFIEEYRTELNKTMSDNAYHFNLATYYYETSKFDEVVELLNRVSFSDVYYEISSKYILMKVYYDLDELSLLGYLISSFEKYIKRNKAISIENRQGIVHFLTILKKLSKIKEWKLYKKRAFIEQQKEKTKNVLALKKPIVNLSWLNQKLVEL